MLYKVLEVFEGYGDYLPVDVGRFGKRNLAE